MKRESVSRRTLITTTGLLSASAIAAPGWLNSPKPIEPIRGSVGRFKDSEGKLYLVQSREPGSGRTYQAKSIAWSLAETLRQPVKYALAEEFMNEMTFCLRFNRMVDFRRHWRRGGVVVIDDVQFLRERDRSLEELLCTVKSRVAHGLPTILTNLLPEGGSLGNRCLTNLMSRAITSEV